MTDADAPRDRRAKTRAQGYATDKGEFRVDMAAVALQILDSKGRLMTTLSIHPPVARRSFENLISVLQAGRKPHR